MTVKELLTLTGGNTRFAIQGVTHKDQYITVAYGTADYIKFPLVPYGKHEIQHISVDPSGRLNIILSDDVRFTEINPDFTDITSEAFCGYLEN